MVFNYLGVFKNTKTRGLIPYLFYCYSITYRRKAAAILQVRQLSTKETASGEKVILPIWHKFTKDEVMKYSPVLADKVAINSSLVSISEIADELEDVIKK